MQHSSPFNDDGPRIAPPVTVIRIHRCHGSMGYGCRIDGDFLLIPYSVPVVEHFREKNVQPPRINIIQVPREWYNDLPLFEEPKESVK